MEEILVEVSFYILTSGLDYAYAHFFVIGFFVIMCNRCKKKKDKDVDVYTLLLDIEQLFPKTLNSVN